MANLRNRDGKWQAQVRRAGHKPRTKSFLSKADAQRWARQMEAELDRAAIPNDTRRLDTCSIADVMNRYKVEVTPKKRGAASELKRIEVFLRAKWTALPLSKATPAIFSDYRDKRLKQVQPGTVLRELGLLRAIFETAIREWEHPLPQNPIASLKKPRAPEGRDRRLLPGELEAIVAACADGRSEWLLPAVYFAVETGMRRGELLKMRWRDVDLAAGVLNIPVTKTDKSRRIPLTDRAVEILRDRAEGNSPADVVFPVSANAFRLGWERCKKRAAKLGTPQVQSLRFHDLRHEAVSRFFEMGLNTAEVASISGHRDLRSLFRYTHLKAEDLVQKLRNAKSARQPEAVQ